MLYFFRDPERLPPPHPACVVAGADGQIMAVQSVPENTFLNTETVRISIFLSLFDVHVNRAPIAGRVAFLNYYPGRRYCTFQEKSSLYNQHSAILIEGEHTRCLVKQIVGPVARRVVYWLHLDQQLAQGERIGMMKFGSRLDIYLPQADVEVLVRKGDKVQAGRSIIAILRQHPELNAFGEQP
ncbi:MAG: phosphatidylserine decarboxylase family protein [Lentisphaerae bacterium]|nr:phosphatidylserine decarboxylase family protein [Lentisphaerota bacterium]